MTIEQHIEELRAELNACADRDEITQIQAELAAAQTYLVPWEETHGRIDWGDRYSVCSGNPAIDLDDVIEWCRTGSLAKAKQAFWRIKHRTELGLITLQDCYDNITIKRVDHRS